MQCCSYGKILKQKNKDLKYLQAANLQLSPTVAWRMTQGFTDQVLDNQLSMFKNVINKTQSLSF